MPTPVHNDVRNLEAGTLLVGVGAVLLFVSLFLEWYQPGVDAWEIFEVWDLVLAALAITALVALASRLGFGAPRPASHVIAPGIAALVIVLYALLDPPPLVSGIDGDPGTGLWLALAASFLMAAGALLSVARVSVAFSRAPVAAEPVAPASAVAYDPVADPLAARPGVVAEPAGPGPFAPRAGAVDPAVGADPLAPGEAEPPPPAGAPGAGRRFLRGTQPADPPPGVPPTEPTRRL